MGAAISMMNYVFEKLHVGAESVMNYAVEKSKELPVVVGNLGGKVVEKSKELPAVIGNLGGNMVGKAAEKWKELLLVVWNMGKNLMGKVDMEQLYQLIQVVKPYAMPTAAAGALLILLYYFSRRGGSGGSSRKMMKAPGRDFMMPRLDFESDPRSYFRDLHGKSYYL